MTKLEVVQKIRPKLSGKSRVFAPTFPCDDSYFPRGRCLELSFSRPL